MSEELEHLALPCSYRSGHEAPAPPPACPNSALNPLVSTTNSVMASTDEEFSVVHNRCSRRAGSRRDAVDLRSQPPLAASNHDVAAPAVSAGPRLGFRRDEVRSSGERSCRRRPAAVLDELAADRHGHLYAIGLNLPRLRGHRDGVQQDTPTASLASSRTCTARRDLDVLQRRRLKISGRSRSRRSPRPAVGGMV